MAPSILVVEDEPALQQLLVSVLEEEGYRAVGVRDGQAALAALEDQMPALILLDLVMPGMGGATFVEELRLRWPAAAPPVLVLTASRVPEAELAQLEVAGHMWKPFELDALLAAVARLL